MNNVLLWVVGVAVVLGGGFIFLQKQTATPADDAMTEQDTSANAEMDKEVTATTGDAAMTPKDNELPTGQVQKGTYEPYAPEKLTKANSGDVVLFFRASWCPTCKVVDSDIRARLSAIPGTLTILDVDYDNSAALKQKYGVTYQHTFVQVKADGTLIKKWSGSPTLAALVAEVQ